MLKMMRYIGLTLSIVALGAGLFFLFSKKSPKGIEEETLIVGLQSGYPPFEWMDKEGSLVGFDVDLAKKIAEKTNKKLIFKDMEFDALIISLQQGKIDCIISGMNITSSRLKAIAMIPYYGEALTELNLVFWGDIPSDISSLKDFEGESFSISVEAGTISEEYLMKKYPSIPLHTFQGALAPLMDVKYGKSTANLVEPATAQFFARQHENIRLLRVPLASEDQILGFGIGVRKDKKELIQKIKQVIEELKQEGWLQQLEKKWFKKEAS
jgi:arginine transport system substrate-binding protein